MSPDESRRGQIAAVRAFNRFYTRKLGVLDQQLDEEPVLAERGAGAVRTRPSRRAVGQGDRHRARPRCRLSQPHRPEFRRRRLDHPHAAAVRPPAIPARADRQGTAGLRQTRTQFAGRSRRDAGAAAGDGSRSPDRRDGRRSNGCSAHAGARSPAILREPPPGDMGWVVQSHGALYASEYGFDSSFEALVAEIAAKFLDLVRRLARTLLDRRHRWRAGRLGLSGAGTATTSPSCGCCWSIRPGADRASASGWSANASRSRASLRLSPDHAVDPEHPGRRAQHLSGRRLQAGRDRAAPQLRPGPDRRDLGARTVKPVRRAQSVFKRSGHRFASKKARRNKNSRARF